MFKPLLKNTIFSALAFSLVSLVGILLVPYLISNYGLALFGLISLARLFMPLAVFGMFDIGLGEMATQAVAKARANARWSHCKRMLVGLNVIAVTSGAVVGLVLYTALEFLIGWFNVEPQATSGFGFVINVTSVIMPLLFFGLVQEGIVKGFENFRMQRLAEVISAGLYALLTIVAVQIQAGFEWVCIAFLIGQMFRVLLVSIVARLSLAEADDSDNQKKPNSYSVLGEIRLRAPGLWVSKFLGTSMVNSPSFIIGYVSGLSAVGVYEALQRIPRFMKAVYGLMNGIVQPIGVRLLEGDDVSSMKKLNTVGVTSLAVVVFPITALLATFSATLLLHWLGSEWSNHAALQAMLFIIPALTAVNGFMASTLMSNVSTVRWLNRVSLAQLIVQTLLGATILNFNGLFGFVVVQLACALVSFVAQFIYLKTRIDLPKQITISLLCGASFLVVLSVLTTFALPTFLVWHQVLWLVPSWFVAIFIVHSVIVLGVRNTKGYIKRLKKISISRAPT